jgi:hypothetical protein
MKLASVISCRDQLTREVEMISIIPIEEFSGEIWYISAGIRLSGNIDLEFGNPEDGLEIQEEVRKIFSNVFLIGCSYVSIREAGANGLLHPQDVGQIDPRIWVYLRLIHPPAPDESAIFLKEAFEGAATGSAVEPNRNLIDRWPNSWLENEEEGTGRVIHVDWDVSRIHLANVIVNLWERQNLVGCF